MYEQQLGEDESDQEEGEGEDEDDLEGQQLAEMLNDVSHRDEQREMQIQDEEEELVDENE